MKLWFTALSTCLMALLSIACASADTLKGNINKSDHLPRLSRPHAPPHTPPHPVAQTPVVAPGTLTSGAQNSVKTGEIEADDFMFSFEKQSGKMAPVASSARTKMLEGDAENAELVIAWEAWHHRVAKAIYEHWQQNSIIPGRALMRLTFTRDRRIDFEVREVHLPPNVLTHYLRTSHSHGLVSARAIEDEFIKSVEQSITPLIGSPLLDFPEKSARQRVVWPRTAFDSQMDATPSYVWKKNDYERLPGSK
jgi:hypothetical protein